ncbi:CPBP family glutamic-type intramembrane protease [Bacillus sp. FJAT-45350]|uniref:CPBP family glutamic-type intramembrane protease n=1 Tax=Bacillus sp. FJAT-45350 TaxID=2011014 RepID=UPI000BB6F6E6|nr:CPBP family glutamic-type intramembrane protease [Bacillus sp. FJAT-45350]
MANTALHVQEINENQFTTIFSKQEYEQLKFISSKEFFNKNDIIVIEEEQSNFLYLIISGSVGLYKENEHISEKKSGDLIGEASITQEKSYYTVKANTAMMVLKIDTSQMINGHAYQHLHIKLLTKVVKDINTKSNIQKKAIEKEQKKYKALGILSSNLLFILSIYTLLLVSLTQFVDYFGVSTYVDIALILLFAYVTFNIMKKSGYPLDLFGLTLKGWRQSLKDGVMLTIPVLLFFFLLKWALITFIPEFSEIPLFNLTAAFSGVEFTYSLFIFTIIVYLIFSIVQEFIARAGLQSAFYQFLPNKKGKLFLSIILSNLLFAMAHSHIGTLFALAAFIPGLFWGWMYSRQKSLIGVCVSHMLIGIWVLFILGFTQFLEV